MTVVIDWAAVTAIRLLQRRDAETGDRYVKLAEKLGEHPRLELDRRILVDDIDRA